MEILVVDDEMTIREFLSEALSAMGYVVDVARDGKEALEKIGDRSYDLIITDVNMPRLDGIGLYKAVCKQFPELKGRFLFLTACASPEVMGTFEEESLPYLLKPFEIGRLIRYIESFPKKGVSIHSFGL